MSGAEDLPAPDWARAPYTGWTREHWQALLGRLTFGFMRAAERYGTPARALLPDDRRGQIDAVDGLEGFARISTAWAAWLSNHHNPDHIAWGGRSFSLPALLRQGLLDGTNPARADSYWGNIGHMDQRIVEAADLAAVLWLSRARVFDCLGPAEQSQVMAWLSQVDGKGTYPDNWVLFPALAQAVRLRLGWPAPEAELDGKLAQAAEFYRGDGWYVDGLADEYELYNAWMFNWHFLLWAAIDGQRRPDLRQQVLARARSFLAGFLGFFGANGVCPAWGRSLVYRFAAVSGFLLGHQLGIAPASPGTLRRLASGSLRYFTEHGMFDPAEHYLRQGYHGHCPAAGEPYISPGSPYWASHGLYALAYDADDAFWAEPEAPLPVEQADYELVLPGPGFVVAGSRASGQVLLLNSRSGQEHDGPGYQYAAKYGKLAYSTHFPFNVLSTGGSQAPDAMLALTLDGRAFGHRLRTRAGAAAPGLIWCRFDEVLDGEPQPVWMALLLWGDRQVRLALVRPTFPVRAFEAPGALGCDGPAGILRRSDPEAGWEYAEAEGRAVAIRRLLGYDAQAPSAPFSGQSNLNLAYAYAEQPLVCEDQPSVAPRCLAAVSLVRPTAFDPAVELADIRISASLDGAFNVQLGPGEAAFVAAGQHRPARAEPGGLIFEGPGLRYARAAAHGGELCGLGVARVAGAITFEQPATFRLRREAPGLARIWTDAGLRLDPGWLGGEPRRVAAIGLEGQAIDLSADCPAGAISQAVVARCAAELEREVIEFIVRA
jgi:hypothetical protein